VGWHRVTISIKASISISTVLPLMDIGVGVINIDVTHAWAMAAPTWPSYPHAAPRPVPQLEQQGRRRYQQQRLSWQQRQPPQHR
jgi:hypothetical protein